MKIKSATILFIALLLLTIFISALQWIPSWENVMSKIMTILFLLTFISGIILIVTIRIYLHPKIPCPNESMQKRVVSTQIPPTIRMVNIVYIEKLFFWPRFSYSHNYPEYGVTIYRYHSTSGPPTRIKIKNRIFPIMHDLHAVDYIPVSIDQQNEKIRFSDGIEFNMKTQELSK